MKLIPILAKNSCLSSLQRKWKSLTSPRKLKYDERILNRFKVFGAERSRSQKNTDLQKGASAKEKKGFLEKTARVKLELFFVFLAFFSFKPYARLVESLKAQVGEVVISQKDLNDFKLQLKQKLVPASLLLKNLYKPSQLLKSEELRLQFMIESQMLSQLAQQKKLPLDEKHVK